MVWQCKLVSGWGLTKRRSALPSGPYGLVKNLRYVFTDRYYMFLFSSVQMTTTRMISPLSSLTLRWATDLHKASKFYFLYTTRYYWKLQLKCLIPAGDSRDTFQYKATLRLQGLCSSVHGNLSRSCACSRWNCVVTRCSWNTAKLTDRLPALRAHELLAKLRLSVDKWIWNASWYSSKSVWLVIVNLLHLFHGMLCGMDVCCLQ